MSDPKKDYVFDIDQSLHYNKNLGFDMDEHGCIYELALLALSGFVRAARDIVPASCLP